MSAAKRPPLGDSCEMFIDNVGTTWGVNINSVFIFVLILSFCRNLHVNGIDELLLFLGSNPDEVRMMS